ncbi:AAA domain-containing protein, partial [Phlyctochytrium arcticum]
ENLIGPRTVVLCSLAQLSNPNLVSVFRARRVTHIVIDEASQISLVNIPHILALYATSLQRLTFVGDPKQLAPFGNEAHPGVESVFERLPADYRMPNDLGSFISRWVYKGRLLTEKKPRTQTSIALVNVEGATEVKSKTSFKNSREADTVVALIMNNYLKEEFLIITPYVAQKDLIVLRLEEAIRRRRAQQKFDVPLELAAERVHTVDTVQGQEANIIVFSAVRTFQPGFLNNKRRMNVALTRAKDRLIIVAKMSLFRSGSGSKSLLGDFVRSLDRVCPMGRDPS